MRQLFTSQAKRSSNWGSLTQLYRSIMRTCLGCLLSSLYSLFAGTSLIRV